MAFQKRPETSDTVATITLPLIYNRAQRNRLNKAFRAANGIKNCLIADRLNALKQLEKTKAWRKNQKRIAYCYRTIKESEDFLKSIKGKRKAPIPAQRKETKASLKHANNLLQDSFKTRENLLEDCGLTQGAFENRIKKYRYPVRKLVHSQVAQKTANDVWKSFQDYLYGSGKEIKFSSRFDFLTISGKSNDTGIHFQDGFIKTLHMRIRIKIDRRDKYNYQHEALSRKVHFCSIKRRWYPNGWRYFVQLTYAGDPPVKVAPETGEVLHPLGKGRVGNDIGPQTLATVSDHNAALVVLAERSQDLQKQLRRINRAMDRSRRAMNPAMFDDKGSVIPITELPPELVSKRGKRLWNESRRYKALASRRRYLYRKQAESRLLQHRELANKLLSLGDQHYIEKMDFSALAKRAKETKISPYAGKSQRKKRFGKSIANKAPAMFVKIYEQKVIHAGGSFQYINTQKAKASQYNHQTFAYKKKHLSKRWNDMPDGRKIQRDLYSAFLIQNTNESLDGFVQSALEEKYANFCVMHAREIERLKSLDTPSSMGVKKVS